MLHTYLKVFHQHIPWLLSKVIGVLNFCAVDACISGKSATAINNQYYYFVLYMLILHFTMLLSSVEHVLCWLTN